MQHSVVKGQWRGGVTTLLVASLGPVPLVLRSKRGRGSSMEYGLRVDEEMEKFCAHGAVPRLPESQAIIKALECEGVSLIATQKAYTYSYRNFTITGVLDGFGVDKKGRHVAVEWKTGFKRAAARQTRLPFPFHSLWDNQLTRAEIQVLSNSHLGKGEAASVHCLCPHSRNQQQAPTQGCSS